MQPVLELPPDWASQVVIRHLSKDDLPDLEWGGEYAHFRRLYGEVYQSACEGKAVLWVAELPRIDLLGQLFVQLTSARLELADGIYRAYIYGFRIKPTYRNQGIGKRMMAVAEQDLLRRNFTKVTLNVACNNPRARQLYDQLGYQEVGTDPGRWSYLDQDGKRQEVHEPAWRMEKALF